MDLTFKVMVIQGEAGHKSAFVQAFDGDEPVGIQAQGQGRTIANAIINGVRIAAPPAVRKLYGTYEREPRS